MTERRDRNENDVVQGRGRTIAEGEGGELGVHEDERALHAARPLLRHTRSLAPHAPARCANGKRTVEVCNYLALPGCASLASRISDLVRVR